MVAGAFFFFAGGEGVGVALGASLATGDAVGLEEGVGLSVGAGVGEGFFFLLGETLGDESELGVGDAFRFLSEGVGVSAAVGEGLGDGDFSGSAFFFAAVDFLRCLCGVGVGLGAKTFLSLSPKDSSAARVCAPLQQSVAMTKNMPLNFPACRMSPQSSTSAHDEITLRVINRHPETRRRREISQL